MRHAKFGSLHHPLAVALLVPLAISAAWTKVALAQTPAEIEERILALKTPAGQKVGGQHLAAATYLEKLYTARQFRPAWSNAENVSALEEAVSTSWTEGLLVDDFHANALGIRPKGEGTALTAVEREILMSDALIRLLYQLYFGKVSPETIDTHWNFKRPLHREDAASAISTALDEGKIGDLIERVRLKHPFYDGLKNTLQAYTEYDVRERWDVIPKGDSLKPGSSDPRIPLVRARLAITGEYEPKGDQSSQEYDETLAAAVKAFQKAQGIEAEGVIGPQTTAALNVSPAERIEQIRINLERARWVLREAAGEPDMVVVNIAGFYLAVLLNGERVWTTDVIVGRRYTKTPVFTESMKYVVLNPDWTIPRSIIRKDVIPKARSDPQYLAKHNYDLVDGNGKRVPQGAIDWSTVTPASFPYRVVQRPGPKNALGLVKFMFPNKYNVYLHDTPSRSLFAKAGRTFSHGCIRVKDPMKLAEIILENRAGWSRSKIDETVAAGKLRNVNLSKPLPVLILYWTVDPNPDGTARFYQDIYGRDSKLLKALNAPFKPAT